MDRRELLDKTAMDAEERLLLSRVWDKWEQCRLRNAPTITGFLSPQEQAAARRLLNALGVRDGFAFCGGYSEAERARLAFLPEWQAEPDGSEVAALRAVCRSGKSLTHRDFLGSLMALGLTREKIGDILVVPGGCQILADPASADFLTQSWESAGRERLTVTVISPDELEVPCPAVKEIRDTVSSLRLDNVLACGFSLSRGKAAEAVEKGAVQVNHAVCMKPDKAVAAQDVLTCRGMGKCVLDSVGAPTRKGRLPVVIRRFI